MPQVTFLATNFTASQTAANFDWGYMVLSSPISASSFTTATDGAWMSDVAAHSGGTVTHMVQLRPVGGSFVTVFSRTVNNVNVNFNSIGASFAPMTFDAIRFDATKYLNQTFHSMSATTNIFYFQGSGRPVRSVNVIHIGAIRRGIYSP